ncbi:Golgi transport complex subunit 5-domain-containing protein [Cokeromyces recurvatus]|uniref:Golgi transport complex subunit 5-domain-containing protein n=1 Tax=Cokeromyces recurvatus TaxID=90255 RepID=UPI002220C7A3|nr:Golgi transport complex subunit 5-domain-containing protein [Cokeromyces recurvatus]KAI7898782.1 Golgi transport complex subunit 5-domain-containing protein [Cokeromyces recurvatus]
MPSKINLQETDKYIDYDTFLSDNFDANNYASSIIKQSQEDDTTDIGVELSKLTFSIDIVNKQIQDTVVANYENLLSQVTGIKGLEQVLNTIQSNIDKLNNSLKTLSLKIKTPYEQLSVYARELENLQETSEILRKLHRFILLKRRLDSQLTISDRDVATAALTMHELDVIMAESDFEGIEVVDCELEFIERSRFHIEAEADTLLKEGIEGQNQAKMAVGLQVFYNLGQMTQRVQEVIKNMLNNLIQNMKDVVEISSNNEVNSPTMTSVRKVNNMNGPSNQLTTTIWARMENLMKKMSDECIKVYSLEKVLEIKKDSLTQVSFLEEVSKTLDTTSLVSYFWRVLSSHFENELKTATKNSKLLQTIFVGEYPKLLKLLHDFFSRVAIYNGTSLTDYSQTPEYVIMLRSFHTFEKSFLAKSLKKMTDIIISTFPVYGTLSRSPPSRSNVLNITRVIGNELETASFEANLLQAVAENAVKALSMFCNKCDNLLPSNDQPIYTTNTSNSNLNNYLNINIEMANTLYYMHQSIWKILEEYPDKVVDIVKKGADDCHKLMMKIGNKLVSLIKKDAETVLLKIHQEDFSRHLKKDNLDTEADSSNYMKELARHVRYYHVTILHNLSCGAEPKSWAKQISKYILYVFIFQASIVCPLNEVGKLKLAGDMAELEFTISQFLSEYGARMEEIGNEYKALRAFRPLLFLDSAQLTAAHHTSGLSKLVLIHHLIVRSQKRLPLPHTVYDLSRQEYMKWMETQSDEKEAVQLAMDAITNGSKLTKAQLDEIPEYKLILQIVSEEDQ